ncbi:hypothetical protein M407DRAFT_245713 [Tulasnella calospora MUT 4182]|uniref:Uncharacterized protein n=1 Tax=Tulasnella calospora MUT 4182 TaxID=1051891 RepID=A0A0C3PZ35_9AGAM|nr:hypothetical protein M407DRAFT_245713 [Tulasnella calospora MUT 4182]
MLLRSHHLSAPRRPLHEAQGSPRASERAFSPYITPSTRSTAEETHGVEQSSTSPYSTFSSCTRTTQVRASKDTELKSFRSSDKRKPSPV